MVKSEWSKMKFYGEEIGKTATLQQVEIYVAEKGLFIEPQEAYDYWAKKNWLNSYGEPVYSLESCINYINGVAVRKSMEKNKAKPLSAKVTKKKALRIERENNSAVVRMTYDEQLKDKCWKAFRKFVFAVRGSKCEICGATKRLQVHHLHYSKILAWEYSVRDVIVVCRDCHKKIHGIKK